MDRSAQPIWVTGYELDSSAEEQPICKYDETDDEDFDRLCFNNRLNAYMDMCWDGFYTCQQREQRFVSMVWTGADSYEITYTGTPPENQRFILHADGTEGFVVRITYSNAGTYTIYDDNDNVIESTEYDVSTESWGQLPRQRCGENRYEGVKNILEFYITPGCPLVIRPRDAIMLGVRLEFTVTEFFASGGVTSFVDRMAASLGIHAADIKVVSVYEGSVIIDFQIISNILDETPLDLEVVTETFAAVVTTMDSFMGSPVLNAVSTGIQLVTPNTELDEDGNIVGAEAFNLDVFGLDSERKAEEKPPEIRVQIKYKEKMASIQTQQNTKAYTVILAGLTLVVAIIVFAVIIYAKISSAQASAIVVKKVPDRVECQPEFEEMELDKQYDPKKELEAANFGGVRLNLAPKRKGKVADDLETLKLDNGLRNLHRGNEKETGRENI